MRQAVPRRYRDLRPLRQLEGLGDGPRRRRLGRADAPRDRTPAGHRAQLRVRAGGRGDLPLGPRPRGPARATCRPPPAMPRGDRPARRDRRRDDPAGPPGLLRLPGGPRGRRPPGGRRRPGDLRKRRMPQRAAPHDPGDRAQPLGGDPQRPGHRGRSPDGRRAVDDRRDPQRGESDGERRRAGLGRDERGDPPARRGALRVQAVGPAVDPRARPADRAAPGDRPGRGRQ